jgi:hypothetical protein
MKNQPIPNDFLNCRCHLGPSEEVDSVLVKGDEVEVTVHPDCPFHAALVRHAWNGAQFSLVKMEMPGGEVKALMVRNGDDNADR